MSRFTRSILAMIAYLIGAAILIWIVAHYFLFPAMEAAHGATAHQKRQLMATSRLMLMVVLFVLSVVTFMLFRVRRFFFPRPSEKPQRTQYVDAWAEAGRRAEAPPEDNDAS
jgi:heme/copper-type cytochrome/quinol oxidase subunit 2